MTQTRRKFLALFGLLPVGYKVATLEPESVDPPVIEPSSDGYIEGYFDGYIVNKHEGLGSFEVAAEFRKRGIEHAKQVELDALFGRK